MLHWASQPSSSPQAPNLDVSFACSPSWEKTTCQKGIDVARSLFFTPGGTWPFRLLPTVPGGRVLH